MFCFRFQTVFILSVIIFTLQGTTSSFLNKKYVECGEYGFACEGPTKLRLCEGDVPFGPTFNCPSNSICNEESSDVCDSTNNYVEPSLSRTLRCHRNERVADPSVAGCKGYILCIPNNNRFQGIKFKCTGNTIFNGFTRTCSTPDKYKCPLYDPKATIPKLFEEPSDMPNVYKTSGIDRVSHSGHRNRPIDCKSYKFVVTQDKGPVRATYFCPMRPVSGEAKVRCTIFSNQFCITLEKDDPDQFIESSRAAYRKPRFNKTINGIYL